MKILYLASKSIETPSLRLAQEITLLQREADALARSVQFVFVPDVRYEDIRKQISEHRPDIVHMSAHGDERGLELVNLRNQDMMVTSDDLKLFLDVDSPPKLLYLNACGSETIARDVVPTVPVAVGISSSITNTTAMQAALHFYSFLISGRTVSKAYAAAKHIIERVDGGRVSGSIFPAPGVDLDAMVMHSPCRIMAQFSREKDRFKKRADGHYEIRFGLVGCPPNTSQIVFFTDDKSYVEDEGSIESDLCSVLRDYSARGELWLEEAWDMTGDIRIFATAITMSGEHLSLGTWASNALEDFYVAAHRLGAPSALPAYIKEPISDLRANVGAELSALQQRPYAPASK